MILKRIRSRPLGRTLVRRVLHAWFLASRGMTLGVRGAVLDAEGRVCLVRHTYADGWHLPGGGVETGEDALTALERELREEAAIGLSALPRLHGIYLNRHVSRRDHVLVYVVREFRILGERSPDREIAEAAFFRLDALPGDTTRGTRERLAEIAAGGTPAAVW